MQSEKRLVLVDGVERWMSHGEFWKMRDERRAAGRELPRTVWVG